MKYLSINKTTISNHPTLYKHINFLESNLITNYEHKTLLKNQKRPWILIYLLKVW